MSEKQVYTYEDWLEGKLDGLQGKFPVNKGGEPFSLSLSGQLSEGELQKIYEHQRACYEKLLRFSLDQYKNFLIQVLHGLSKEEKLKFLESEIRKYTLLEDSADPFQRTKIAKRDYNVDGFDAAFCQKVVAIENTLKKNPDRLMGSLTVRTHYGTRGENEHFLLSMHLGKLSLLRRKKAIQEKGSVKHGEKDAIIAFWSSRKNSLPISLFRNGEIVKKRAAEWVKQQGGFNSSMDQIKRILGWKK